MLLRRIGSRGAFRSAVCRASQRFVGIRLQTRAAATEVSTTVASYPAPTYKVNLDFKFIANNVDMIADNCRLRDSTADPRLVAQLYEEYVSLKATSDNLRASRNDNSAAMKVCYSGCFGVPMKLAGRAYGTRTSTCSWCSLLQLGAVWYSR